jgi:diaminohydroxyphosphoribosylaminopyrimidine deaminase/5-amino-6-(5-phosphoribosylamino)uracil reductase
VIIIYISRIFVGVFMKNDIMNIETKYMQRALELARHGEGNTRSNPMVGAVIVSPAGKILGEGYHRQWGKGHAEVNAIASVADESSLKDATMYVTLEPCSHYGKTPPCARLIIDKHIPRVVVGAMDPFEKVSGRGVKMMRDAGVEVVTGCMAAECERLNNRFMTAHRQRRPFIMLKWAQSSDGFMDKRRSENETQQVFSTELSAMEMHRLRAHYDAIMVGSNTVIADNPSLTVRNWTVGAMPTAVVMDRRGRVPSTAKVFDATNRDNTIYITTNYRNDLDANVRQLIVNQETPLNEILSKLYDLGITSLMVEGGTQLLNSFLNDNLWDLARVEVSPICLGNNGCHEAPVLDLTQFQETPIEENILRIYSRNGDFDVKNL